MSRLKDDDIHYYLEIPDDQGGLTDLESDGDDPQPIEGYDFIQQSFDKGMSDVSLELPPKGNYQDKSNSDTQELHTSTNGITETFSPIEPVVLDETSPPIEPVVLDETSPPTEPVVLYETPPPIEPVVLDETQPPIEPVVLDVEVNNFDLIFEKQLSQLGNGLESNSDTEQEFSASRDSVKLTKANVDKTSVESSTAAAPKQTCQKTKASKVNTNEKNKKVTKKCITKSTSKTKKKGDMNRNWSQINRDTVIPPYIGKIPGPVGGVFDSCKTPTSYFVKTIEPVIQKVVYESNLYAVQQGRILATDKMEILSFIGINFLMGYKVLPSWKDYWSTSSDLGCSIVKNTMSRNRFDLLLNNLHINDSMSIPTNCDDKLYKIRPLIEGLNEQFIKIYNVNRDVAVDESIILFKGRSSLKQYNPMKPIKRGYKLWCLADNKGYVAQFDVYQGKFGPASDDEDLKNFGATEQVVLRLTKPFWNTNVKVYFDNFYSSVPLLEKLQAEQVLACGTIRSDRNGFPSFPEEKMTRGDFHCKISNLGIAAYKWMDNRPVCLISNYHGSGKVSVKRKNMKGEKLEIACPEVVRDYNAGMGGVDLADQLRQYYCVNRRSKKWWHRLFWGIIDIAFINSFVIYNCSNPKMSVLEYRRSVAQGLMAKSKTFQAKRKSSTEQPQPKRGKNCEWSVPNDVRLSNRGVHYVVFSEKRSRCEVCSKKKIESRPYSYCNMCKVFVCSNDKKNCFKEFHELQ